MFVLKEKEMRVGKYSLTTTIGQGTFGRVKLGVDTTTGREYAVKIMNKNDIVERELTTNVRREIGIMKQLNHRNIVGLHEVLSSQRKIYMVMDLVRGGELFKHMDRCGETGEDAVRRYFQQMIDGLDYCHRRGVCHRDLKPENLLVNEFGVLKVTDFGVSAVVKTSADGDAQMLHTACGTPYYCAPEILMSRGEGYDGTKIDSWSSGVILYRMLSGELPFHGQNLPQLINALERGNVKYPSTISDEAVDLLKKLLEKNPTRRLSINEVKKHQWFLVDYEENKAQVARDSGYAASSPMSRDQSKKSDSTEDYPINGGRGHSRSLNVGETPPEPVGRHSSGNEYHIRGHSSSAEDANGHQLCNTGSSSGVMNGARRRSEAIAITSSFEKFSSLEQLIKELLGPRKIDKVSQVVESLNDVGCEDVDDFRLITLQYSTDTDLVDWLEEKAKLKSVLAMRLAMGLNKTQN